MPLYRIPAQKAVENRKSNPYGAWGDRGADNRVEPIARPGFAVPFRIKPGESIFTVGSCFARNVEEELLRRGFRLPMRDIRFEGEAAAYLNNYGTPSIYNEFAWAFGEQQYDPQDHIVEVLPGKFADLHLNPTLRPAPREEVLARRAAISNAYRASADCGVMIMTLGLVETWYDARSGYYLNSSPRPSSIRSEPDRFEMHVLSFEETFDFLEKAVLIARRHSKHDLKVILTVSPVPLTSTHRSEDVMVANAYSKAVLRAAAETLIAKHDFVTYYPSYESVTLSDRSRAWRDDLIHVTRELVALNVGRMVDAYVDSEYDPEETRNAIAAGGHAVAVEKAREHASSAFFEAFGYLSSECAEFAAEHARFLLRETRFAEAHEIVARMPDGLAPLQGALLLAEVLVGLGRPLEAVKALEPFSVATDGTTSKRNRAAALWKGLMNAALATNDVQVIMREQAKFLRAVPQKAGMGHLQVGRWHEKQGDLDAASNQYRLAIAANLGSPANLHLASILYQRGHFGEARDALQRLHVADDAPGITIKARALRSQIEDALAQQQNETPVGQA